MRGQNAQYSKTDNSKAYRTAFDSASNIITNDNPNQILRCFQYWNVHPS
jgi:predicted phage tail protein